MTKTTLDKICDVLVKEEKTLLDTTPSTYMNTYSTYPAKLSIEDAITDLEKDIDNSLNTTSTIQRTILLEQAKRLDKLSKLITKHYMTSLLTSRK